MSNMNGNPHYNWDWAHNLLYHRDSPLGEVLAAQVDATLAAAYEQRTANLIAVQTLSVNMLKCGGNVSSAITERLGLDGDTK